MTRLSIVGAGLLILTACTVGPDYVKPSPAVPAAWSISPSAPAVSADSAWWAGFNDPRLEALVQTALAENLDLKTAAARVDQYLGLLETARSGFFPQIGADASIGTQRKASKNSDVYQAGLSGTWELDLWGKIRRANEAARAQLLASEQGRRGVLLTMVCNMATGYITLRGLDRQLEIARQTEDTFAGNLEIFKLRYEYGAISQLQLSQAESLYESARQTVPGIESQIRQQENLLRLLLGQLPGTIPRGRAIDELAVPGIPEGLPSSLLQRRPDILEAEQALVAANAQIGVARAAYFPTISLTGVLGSVSNDLGNLFNAGTAQSSLVGGLAAPVLHFGAISGQVKQSEALQQQALLRYRQTVLNAFREVEDALIKTAKVREEILAQRNQVAALSSTARVSRLQFEAGTVDYLHVLDAERSLFSAQLSLAQKETETLVSLVDVFKAMGGGWIDWASETQAR